MANYSLPSLPSFFVLLIASTLRAAVSLSTVSKDTLPCTPILLCAECENPCQPLPPPPPVIDCPPPPSPPPPSPPPSPLLPPPDVECPPPPPKPTCPGNCGQAQGPPGALYPPGSYYPPYFPVPHNNNNGYNSGGKTAPFSAVLYVAFLCLLFI